MLMATSDGQAYGARWKALRYSSTLWIRRWRPAGRFQNRSNNGHEMNKNHRKMKHSKVAAWLGIAVLWILMAGLIFTLATNINILALGWSSWLLYGVVAIAVIFAVFVLTKKLWSSE